MHRVSSLFPTPFLFSYLEVTPSVLEFAKCLEYERLQVAYNTVDKNILEYPHMREYKEFIWERLCDYFYDICGMSQSAVPIITTSWINLNRQGDYQEPHIHYNSVLSGVWYLSVTENSGDFIVMRERGKELFGSTFNFAQEHLNEFNAQSSSILPKNGDLFIFPSSLDHKVGVNLEQFDRLSLGFNCLIKGSLQEGVPEIIM